MTEVALKEIHVAGASAGRFAGRRLLIVINEAYFLLSHRLALARRAQREGFEIHVAAPLDHVWAPSGFDVEALRREGFVFHSIPLQRRSMNPVHDLQTLVALIGLFRRVRPDIIHLVTLKPNLYGGLAARLAGVPAVVFAVTGLGHLFSGRGLLLGSLRVLIEQLLRVALHHPNSVVIFQNETDRDRLVAGGAVEAGNTALMSGAGVDLATFTPTDEPPPPVVIVMASRLIWDKGVGEFVEAARRLRNSGVSARFVLVGRTHPSNPRAVPQALLEQWVKEGVVEWWGFRTDMSTILAQSHVFCLPSQYGEGAPKVLLEAAASGRPVVTTSIPGCRHTVEDGVTGLLVEPGDVAGLAQALRALVEDASFRRRLGRNARHRAEAAFDEQTIASSTMDIYDSLLGAGK